MHNIVKTLNRNFVINKIIKNIKLSFFVHLCKKKNYSFFLHIFFAHFFFEVS